MDTQEKLLLGVSIVALGLIINIMVLNNKVNYLEKMTDKTLKLLETQND